MHLMHQGTTEAYVKHEIIEIYSKKEITDLRKCTKTTKRLIKNVCNLQKQRNTDIC